MRTLESALRDSAEVLRREASRVPERPWISPRRPRVTSGVVVGLSAAALVLLAFALPMWLAGHTGNDPSNLTPPVAVSPAPPDTLADDALISPVLEFQSQGLSSDEFHNETQHALASCMQEHGWTYEPSLQESVFTEPRTIGDLREFRYAHGYGLYTQPEPSGPSEARRAADRNYDFYLTLDEEQQTQYRTDFNGDISGEGEEPVAGSCEAVADQAVDIPLNDDTLMEEVAGLYALAMLSPEYTAAETDWRACLAERGYDLERDGHPADLLDERAAAEVPSEELAALEITVAVDDFECAFTTTMPVRHRLETEVVEELVAKYPRWDISGGR